MESKSATKAERFERRKMGDGGQDSVLMIRVRSGALLSWNIHPRPCENLQAVHMAERLTNIAYPKALLPVFNGPVQEFVNERGGIAIGYGKVVSFADMNLTDVAG